MKQTELAQKLAEWFKSKANNPNLWNDNPVGKLIRGEIEKRGNWKQYVPRRVGRNIPDVFKITREQQSNAKDYLEQQEDHRDADEN